MTDDQPSLADVEAAAMRYLGRRPHAEGELRRKLGKKDFPGDLIDQACQKMREFGYLDDAEFAQSQAAILIRKGWGPRQIAYKLGERGVDSTVVDQALAELAEAADWLEHCRARAESKYRCAPEELDRDGKKKAFRHLKYRGFRASTIRRVLFDGAG